MSPTSFGFDMDFSKIQPSDVVVVYHGTRVAEVFELINGFDATRVKYRHYGGPRHAGLFVTPDFKVAERFSSYGELVLELVVRAKNLHGTDYSGNIGRKQEMSERTLRSMEELYPESFRPYLSVTMSQPNEPQALLLGLVSPKQVRRVWYNPNREGGAWYTREEFLSLGLEVTPAVQEPYGPKRPLKDYGLDMSSTRLSVDQLLEALSRLHGRDIASYFQVYRNNPEALAETLVQLGFGPLAARSHAKKLVDYYSRAKLARILKEEGISVMSEFRASRVAARWVGAAERVSKGVWSQISKEVREEVKKVFKAFESSGTLPKGTKFRVSHRDGSEDILIQFSTLGNLKGDDEFHAAGFVGSKLREVRWPWPWKTSVSIDWEARKRMNSLLDEENSIMGMMGTPYPEEIIPLHRDVRKAEEGSDLNQYLAAKRRFKETALSIIRRN